MENREYLNSLFDIYGELLTDIEKETFTYYYIEDLSLTEIADNRLVSKSSVGKTLTVVEAKLKNYETKLNILAKTNILKNVLEEENITKIKEKIKEMI